MHQTLSNFAILDSMSTNAEQLGSSQYVERAVAAIGAAGLVSGAGVVAYFDPTQTRIFPVCPLYQLTGFACPGCGLTRGFHSLFHGDIIGALDYNAMLPFFAVFVGFGLIAMIYYAVKGSRIPVNILKPNVLWVFLVMLMVFGALRNLPWYPFSVLFP
jgi:hypothetical protein